MSRRYSSKICDVSETDTTESSSSQSHRHNYYTRSSGKNTNTCQPLANRKANTSQPVVNISIQPNRSDDKNCEGSSSSSPEEMDPNVCNGLSGRPKKRIGCFCMVVLTFLCALLVAAICLLLWTVYELHTKVKLMESTIQGKKGEDPQEKLFKQLDKKYSATLRQLLEDPVGRADYALESTGGRVLRVTGVNYDSGQKSFLGFTFCKEGIHGPSAMIRATNSPGECWAFSGQSASAVIQLIGEVKIDAVTLEHIPSRLSPSGNIDSAPKDFKIWGLPKPKRDEKTLLGEFVYEAGSSTLQTYKINNNTNYYKYVEFEVLSNHGNKDYTCVYRIRVHGKLRTIE